MYLRKVFTEYCLKLVLNERICLALTLTLGKCKQLFEKHNADVVSKRAI